MATNEELERRIIAVEGEVQLAKTMAVDARFLAVRADRDVSVFNEKLEVHKVLIEALRETQIDHGRRLDEHGKRLERIERTMDEGFKEMRNGFSTMAIGQAEITKLITKVIEDK
jgi:hypothetical protein